MTLLHLLKLKNNENDPVALNGSLWIRSTDLSHLTTADHRNQPTTNWKHGIKYKNVHWNLKSIFVQFGNETYWEHIQHFPFIFEKNLLFNRNRKIERMTYFATKTSFSHFVEMNQGFTRNGTWLRFKIWNKDYICLIW